MQIESATGLADSAKKGTKQMYASFYTMVDAASTKIRIIHDADDKCFWLKVDGITLGFSEAEFHELEMQCRAAWARAGKLESDLT